MQKLHDYLNLLELGGLNVLALELRWFARWYFPVGFFPIASVF